MDGPSYSRVLVFRNPKAGARSGEPLVQRLEGLLGDHGFRVELVSDVDVYKERKRKRDGLVWYTGRRLRDGAVADY